MKTWYFLELALLLSTAHVAGAVLAGRSLSLADQVGQMTMVDINSVMIPGTGQLDASKLRGIFQQYRIGSVFNSPSSDIRTLRPLSLTQWRALVSQVQTIARSEGSQLDIIYGIDSVHGAGYIYNATLFPQQIGLAATFDPTLAHAMGVAVASETRAAGLAWNFAPILEVATQPSWPRVYETFGEDPLLVSAMGAESVKGMQGSSLHYSAFSVAATLKHFIGYSHSTTGQDRTPAWIPDNMLSEYFLPPFEAAVQAGASTVMENYIELNGRPVVASHKYLVDLLRTQLGFPGVLVTDYNEIDNLNSFHRAAATVKEAARQAIGQTSIDVSMQSSWSNYSFVADVQMLVQEGQLDPNRIAESADRILDLKAALGLLEGPGAPLVPPLPEGCVFGCPEFHESALNSARESITLLQNNGALPLSRGSQRLLVVGPSGNSLALQAGGWTMHWQGAADDSEFAYGTTVLQGVRTEFPSATVTYEKGCNVTGQCDQADLDSARTAALASDVIIACIGEPAYTEKPGDVSDLTLSAGQLQLVRELAQTGKPLVLVLIEGRARLLQDLPNLAAAVLMAYLPGPYGGQGIAEVLSGTVNPSGRLPISYPSTTGNAPLQYWVKPSQDYAVQWAFGHGLSYSTFEYLDCHVTVPDATPTGFANVDVELRNDGPFAGKEVVLVYVAKQFRQVTPERRRLRAFTKLSLQNGERTIATLSIPLRDLAYFDESNCQILEAGDYTVTVGTLQRTLTVATGFAWPCPATAAAQKPAREPRFAGGRPPRGSGIALLGVGAVAIVGGLLFFVAVQLVRSRRPLAPALAPRPLLEVSHAP